MFLFYSTKKKCECSLINTDMLIVALNPWHVLLGNSACSYLLLLFIIFIYLFSYFHVSNKKIIHSSLSDRNTFSAKMSHDHLYNNRHNINVHTYAHHEMNARFSVVYFMVCKYLHDWYLLSSLDHICNFTYSVWLFFVVYWCFFLHRYYTLLALESGCYKEK